jgi:hypothetical protein
MTNPNPKNSSAKGNVTALPVRVNLRIAQRHLDLLGGGEFTFQTFSEAPDGKTHPKILHGTLAQHGETLRNLNDAGAGVFIAVNKTDGKGRKIENIVGVRSNWVDLDGAPLSPVLEFPAKPDIMTETSPGKYHVYWTADATRATDLAGFTGRQHKLAELFHGDHKVCDLPHVLRLAGFIHRKGKPFRVDFVRGSEQGAVGGTKATAQDFDTWLADVVATKTTAQTERNDEPLVELDKKENINWAIDYLINNAAPSNIPGASEVETLKVAMILRGHGVSEQTAVELMLAHYNVPEKCEPLWEPEDLTTKVANAYKYGHLEAPGEATAEADFIDDVAPSILPGKDSAIVEKQISERKKLSTLTRPGETPEKLSTFAELCDEWVYIKGAKRFVCRSAEAVDEDDGYRKMWDKEAFDDAFDYTGRTGKLKVSKTMLARPTKTIRRLNGLCYKPGKKEFIGHTYNLYVPSSVVPKQGDTSVWNAHIEYLFPDQADRDHLLNWFGWLLQHQDLKPKHALLLIGKIPGSGKSFVFEVVERILGRHNVSPVAETDLEGSFNRWAMATKLVLIEELRALDKRHVKNKLHPLITQERIYINDKNEKQLTIMNCFGIGAMSNDPAAIPLDDHDRRWLVLQTFAGKREGRTLYGHNGKGGILHDPDAIAAIAYELMNRPLGDYSAGDSAPATKAKDALAIEGASDIEHWMMEHAGEPPLCYSLVTVDDISAVMPKRLLVLRALDKQITKSLQRHFKGEHLGQTRLKGVNGPRPNLWCINGAEIDKDNTTDTERAAIYHAERTTGGDNDNAVETDPLADIM